MFVVILVIQFQKITQFQHDNDNFFAFIVQGEKLLMNVLPKIDNQTTIDVFDDEEEEDEDDLEFSSEDEKKKPTAINNKHKQ